MPDINYNWDPDEWELHVFGLLQDRHGPLNIHRVPARHKGDHGIDYYSLTDRVVYQCYAVQQPCGVAERADNQKSKITTDLRKFCNNRVELHAIFGDVQISRWILVVPLHDSSQVNAHVTQKTADVRALGLPYVAPDFEVMIQDLNSFDPVSREARAMRRRSVSIPRLPATPEQIDEWCEAARTLVDSLRKKLRKRVSVEGRAIEEDVEEVVGWFLERENSLENLRMKAPELHETIMSIISLRSDRLRLSGPPPEGSAHRILKDELDELIAELQGCIPNFSKSSAQQIALGTIADWLLRCPLDFPPYGHAS